MIGSGAGGGAAAGDLARAGRRVLVVERGARFDDPSAYQDERRMLFDREAADDRRLLLNGARERLITGGVLGGSTAVFGAALLRPGPSDFVPGRYYGEHLPRHLWDWPIAYEEFLPYLHRAEDLYRVSGDHSLPAPHLGRRLHAYPQPAPPLEPIGERLLDSFRAQGLSPFRLPLAIDFERCLRCPTCPGYYCPNGARASSHSAAIEPARRAKRGALDLWERCEAEQLIVEGGRARALRVRFRKSGTRAEVRADTYLVAAGAVGTPVLLLRSGLEGESGQVGRNHMCHLGAVPIAIFPRSIGSAERFVKQIGLSDFYLGTREFPHKLGYAQCIPVPGPLSLAKHAPFPVPAPLARWLHERTLLFTGSIEDLPQASNRVRLGPGGEIRLERRFHPYDVHRARYLVRWLARALRGAGTLAVLRHVAEKQHAHVGHQVGTCRFGRDPRHSVLDAQCRLHGHDNLYVVDGSFMPTSLGVGPALTIVANALRVTSQILKDT